MKRTALLFSMAMLATAAMADETDWLNFATGSDGTVVESVLFRNQGKLMFGETEMVYEDEDGRRTIPYTGGAHIYFGSEAATAIESVSNKGEMSLVYSRETQQITVIGADAASQIRLVSMQGSLLRVASNSQTISTAGLPPCVVIATAVCNGKTVSQKFIIK